MQEIFANHLGIPEHKVRVVAPDIGGGFGLKLNVHCDEIATVVKRATVVRANSMEEAVEKARAFAEPGDVVLLSPGCASFDMFRSAEHRGQLFADAVRAQRGAVTDAR